MTGHPPDRWLEDVPLRDGADAMTVNWLEIEIVDGAGKLTYRNSFVTDLPVSAETVAELAACGRARWKIENESFNVLKTKGYNLEHNFGHGQQHLAAVLATMNLLAFAFHTVCELADTLWHAALAAARARRRFSSTCAPSRSISSSRLGRCCSPPSPQAARPRLPPQPIQPNCHNENCWR